MATKTNTIERNGHSAKSSTLREICARAITKSEWEDKVSKVPGAESRLLIQSFASPAGRVPGRYLLVTPGIRHLSGRHLGHCSAEGLSGPRTV